MRNTTSYHYHHADGSALGGRIRRPFDKLIPPQASISLPPVGGYGSIRQENYDFEGLISFKSAHTEVYGNAITPEGPWTTVVNTVVEGLNVAGIVTADRISAHMATEHPPAAEGLVPRISFLGTDFVNVRVGGELQHLKLNLDMCSHEGNTLYPQRSCFLNEEFRARVRDQRRALAKKFSDAGSKAGIWRDRISQLAQSYPGNYPDASVDDSGYIRCSLVEEIQGQISGVTVGNMQFLPDFGVVYFGELVVDFDSFQLIPLRFQLGCQVDGDGSSPSARVNGKTVP